MGCKNHHTSASRASRPLGANVASPDPHQSLLPPSVSCSIKVPSRYFQIQHSPAQY
jgi:hypothetical protein